jgi:hypothetical protein
METFTLWDESDSSCDAAMDWIDVTDPGQGVYGFSVSNSTGACMYEDFYSTSTMDEEGNPLTTTGPWGMEWALVDVEPVKLLSIYLENTEMFPGEYAELYSYDPTMSTLYLKDTTGSKCLGTPDWKDAANP